MYNYLPKVSPDFKLGKALHREGRYPPHTPPTQSLCSLAHAITKVTLISIFLGWQVCATPLAMWGQISWL